MKTRLTKNIRFYRPKRRYEARTIYAIWGDPRYPFSHVVCPMPVIFRFRALFEQRVGEATDIYRVNNAIDLIEK